MNLFYKFPIIFLVASLFSCSDGKGIQLEYDTNSAILSYGATQLKDDIETGGYTLQDSPEGASYIIHFVSADQKLNQIQNVILKQHSPDITPDGYKIRREGDHIYVIGKTERGCLYGIQDIKEQLKAGADISTLEERQVNPTFNFRAIKFNLPWSPYRPGPATDLHTETCKDLSFWEAYLDMMVENRYNALSLWNTHPFPYMIRAKNYPEATPFSNEELSEWKVFWKSLFKMAKDRGIETYLVNWNIVVSTEFAEAYGAKEHFDRSELVKKYTRESVTQVINEYENLTGLGVTLADWMGNWGEEKMTPTEREDWIEDTFVKGMAQADRKIKFIHRAVLAGDPKEMRRVIDKADLPDKTIVEVKFNWSHGQSTPKLSLTHSNDEGTIMRDFWDPKPENFFIAWMIRNEDFFVLRWGDPDFIRQHIKTNHHDYVDGYFVGSEGYIPAKDYSHIEDHPHKTWNYAFEKQWLYYRLWGRLIYDANETDKALAAEFEVKYPKIDGLSLLKAHSLASKTPEFFASFFKGTWDFTLYSEGFLAPWIYGYDDQQSPFISIAEFIDHETLDANYISIKDYCEMKFQGQAIAVKRMDPLTLAEIVQGNSEKAMALIKKLRAPDNEPSLQSELDDLETWCHLGYYFSDKLRAGVALKTYQLAKQQEDKEKTLLHLEKCLSHWEKVIQMTQDRYRPMPYVSMGHHEPRWPEFTSFHWSNYLIDVKADLDYVLQLEK